MEQCSSEQTARYKASLAQRLTAKGNGERDATSFIDLTGGFGVDFYFMAQGFQHSTYVELNTELCAISSENFQLLGLCCSVVCGSAIEYLANMERATLVYLDPARRNEHGGRTYDLKDCTPNVVEMLPQLMQKAEYVMLKLSPMLDWRKAVSDLQCVSEVHIVSAGGECKELLLVLNARGSSSLQLICVNDDQVFQCPTESPTGKFLVTPKSMARYPVADEVSAPEYLYEPNASIMKAGCFHELEACFPVRQVAEDSHLFLSDQIIDDFPGRKFQILSVSTMNKREIKQKFSEKFSKSLVPLKSANITVRHFPMTVDQLRRKLKLRDGGDVYIFATTAADGSHLLYICRKIG